MTRTDIDNLFELLKIYFPNTPKANSMTLKNAWYLLLEPYSPEAVKSALVERLRENRNFPDAQAVAVKCAPCVPARPKAPVNRHAPPTPSEERSMEKLREWQAQWHKELKEMGLPTFKEALADGMAPGEWSRMLVAAGVFAEAGYGG